MQIFTKDDLERRRGKLYRDILNGFIFIYPTDTIYGIGCNAKNKKAVAKIREIKQRSIIPFSVMAPSKEWIYKNCIVAKKAEEWINKLPGPFTFIFPLKNKKAVANNVNPGLISIGIRIPNHWSHSIAKSLNTPIITTSVNISGEEFMISLNNLNPKIKNKINFILYEGKKENKPSQIIDFTRKEKKIIKR